MKQDQWFYSIDGKNQQGAVTKADIFRLLQEGTLTSDSLVWNAQLGDWKPVRDVDEIDWQSEVLPPPLPKQNLPDEESLHKSGLAAPNAASKGEPDIDEVVLYEESKATDVATKEGDLPVRWLNFYIYVRVPLCMVRSLLFFGISLLMFAEEPAVLVFMGVLTGIDIGLSIFLFIGLHRRRVWGWRLNWVVLVLEVFLRPLDRAEDAVMYIVFLIAALLLWLLPNAIYFSKRRQLFT